MESVRNNALKASIFDFSDTPMVLIDGVGAPIEANSAFSSLYGIEAITNRLGKAERQALLEAIEKAQKEPSASLNILVVTQEERRLMSSVIIKRIDAAPPVFLAQFENKYASLASVLRFLPFPFYIKSPGGYILSCSDRYTTILGADLTVDDMIGYRIQDIKGAALNRVARSLDRERVVVAQRGSVVSEVIDYDAVSCKFVSQLAYTGACFFDGYEAPGFISLLLDLSHGELSGALLHRSIDLIRHVIDMIDSQIYIKDNNKNILAANKAFLSRYAVDLSDIEGKNFFDIIKNRDIAESLAAQENDLLENQAVSAIESPLYDANGEPIGIGRHQAHQFMVDGNKSGIVGMVEDITAERDRNEELIKAHLKVEKKSAFLQMILDSLPTPMYVKDVNNRFTQCNKTFAQTFGKTSAEMVGLTFSDLSMDRDVNEQIDAFDLHFAKNPIIDVFLMDFRYPNGALMKASGHYSPIYDAHMRYMGLVCLIFDITEEWRLQKRLQENELRWQLAMRATSDAIWDFNVKEGNSFYYSPRLMELLKASESIGRYTPKELIALVDKSDEPTVLRVRSLIFDSSDTAINEELRVFCRDGEYRWMQFRAFLIRDDKNVVERAVGVVADITDRKGIESRMLFQATHDQLTGLSNRSFFQEQIFDITSNNLGSGAEELFAICMLDLDGFKKVNDTFGHQAGDELLIHVAKRLRNAVNHYDVVSRLGGDEFIFILRRLKDKSMATAIMTRAMGTISEPVMLVTGPVHISCSIGIAFSPFDGTEGKDLMHKADTAMYHAKKSGKGRIETWSVDLDVGLA